MKMSRTKYEFQEWLCFVRTCLGEKPENRKTALNFAFDVG